MSWELIERPLEAVKTGVRVSCFHMDGRLPEIAVLMDASALDQAGIATGGHVSARIGSGDDAGQLWLSGNTKGHWRVRKLGGCEVGRIVLPAPDGFKTPFTPVTAEVRFSEAGCILVLPNPDGTARKDVRPGSAVPETEAASLSDAKRDIEPETAADLVDKITDDIVQIASSALSGKAAKPSPKPKPKRSPAALPTSIDLRKFVCKLPASEKAHMDRAQTAFWKLMRRGAEVDKLALANSVSPPLPATQVGPVLRALAMRVKPHGALLREKSDKYYFAAQSVQPEPASQTPDDNFSIPDAAYADMKPILRLFFDTLKFGGVVPIVGLQLLRDDMTVTAAVMFINTLRKLIDPHGLIIQKQGEAYQMQSFEDEVARAST